MIRPRTTRTRCGPAIVVSLLVVLVASSAFLVGCDAAVDRMADRAIAQQQAPGPADWLEDDAMYVVLCGTGSPLADAARASACTAIVAGGKMYLVDVGPSSTENNMLWRMPLAELDGIFLTHFHSDHIGELGEAITQSWIAGRGERLNVYGPPGVDKVVGGMQVAYQHDRAYRVAHHGKENLPVQGARARPIPTPMVTVSGDDSRILDKNGLTVTVFPVNHEPVSPAVGYRFDYKGRSVVISGDTVRSASLEAAAKDADLLVHEVLAKSIIEKVSKKVGEAGLTRMSKLASDVLDYHTDPAEAVASGRAAGVDTIVFSHLVPAVPPALQDFVFTRGVDDGGEIDVVVGKDGMYFRLAAGGEEVEIGELE